MKNIFLFLFLTAILFVACSPETPPQPKTNYEVYSTAITGATSYNFFLEKKSAVAYKLVQGMDYLAPDVFALKIGTSTTPSFTVNLANDGSEYTVGVVAVNAANFYSGMGVATGIVGIVPTAPAGVGLRKK